MAYGFDRDDLWRKLTEFQSLGAAPAQERYSRTRKAEFTLAYEAPLDESVIRSVCYRPLDTRQLYNRRGYVDWPRPKLQQVWGDAGNLALFALPNGTASGPAIWCHGQLPDRHAFRGSYGGYAFPLYDNRPGQDPINLKPELIAALGDAYGSPVTPESVFDTILALLSATSYTTRFAEDLEDVFPHVPFPAVRAEFDAAAALGAEIRAVETFARPPEARFMKGLAVYQTPATGPLAHVEYDEGVIRLCADGSGLISDIPEPVWSFVVSGYRLLPRWLAAREGVEIGDKFVPDLRDVAGRIAELIDLFGAADSILARTLNDPLSREALGMAPAPATGAVPETQAASDD